MATHKIQVEHTIKTNDANPTICSYSCGELVEEENNCFSCTAFRVRLRTIGAINVVGVKRCKTCLKKTGDY